MNELTTHGAEAEVNGMHGFALGVEPLEERIAPLFLGLFTFASVGFFGFVGFGGGSSS